MTNRHLALIPIFFLAASALADETPASRGSEGVQLNILSDFESGSRRGQAGDHKMARIMFEQGAKKGDAQCMFGLGTQDYFGEGVKKNVASARKWFEAAIEKGDGPSAYMLAAMTRNGDGAKADEAKANELLMLAANRCVPQAQSELAARLHDGSGIAPDKLDAIAWLAISSDNESNDAAETRTLVKQIKDGTDPADRDAVAKLEAEHRAALKCRE